MSPFMLRGDHGRGGANEYERSGQVRGDPAGDPTHHGPVRCCAVEDRAPKNCLIAFIDDATGDLMQACFYPVESTRPEQPRYARNRGQGDRGSGRRA